MRLNFGFFVLAASFLGFISHSVQAEDWTQWLGPNRDSIWRETGVVDSIPKSGLKVKWRQPVAYGYSGPAVADGRVFVPDYEKKSGKFFNSPGGTAELTGTERLVCLDEKTGNPLWLYDYSQDYKLSYPGGPRCTPTVDGDRVYFLGAEGKLACLNVESGKPIWKVDFKQDYGAKTPIWGHSASPLVVDDLLVCIVGGKGSVAVAFDKKTGKEVWKGLDAPEQGYCPPTLIQHGRVEQLLIWHPESLNSLDPQTGSVYWSQPIKPQFRMSVTVPRLAGDSLFVSGIGSVGARVDLNSSPKPSSTIAWRGNSKSAIYCCNSTPIIEGDVIYGCDIDSGDLVAASFKDGKRLWATNQPTSNTPRPVRHATAFLVKNGDRYFLFSETGDLILANLTPEKYEELGRFHVLEPTNEAFGRKVVWSHPAFANKCLFARNDKEIVCVDLSTK